MLARILVAEGVARQVLSSGVVPSMKRPFIFSLSCVTSWWVNGGKAAVVRHQPII